MLPHSAVYQAHTSPGRLEALSITTRRQRYDLAADVCVDATGDGTVSALAGAAFEMGEGDEGPTQPMTLVFQLGNIDTERCEATDWIEGMPGFCINHVTGRNPLDAEDLTQAEIDSKRQALEVLRFFRRHVRGCERCHLSAAADIGVRESRRIIGDYVLTREDVLGRQKFEDSIGCSNSWIDIHSPEASGVLHELVKPDNWFEIPFRSIRAKGFDNLMVAGRCISATHEAQGAIREIPTCILVVQGAGVAAALAAKADVPARHIDVGHLQEQLVRQDTRLRQA